MPTPHNNAEIKAIAKTVLMPGDPLRSRFIAETFLDDPLLVNDVRGINGYTGTWKGVPVTVMASGMGMPSIGIYSYELYKFYDVDNIIRIGSAGAYDPDLHVLDVVLASGAYSESTFAKVQCGSNEDTMYPSEELNEKLRTAARNLNIPLHEGIIHSGDVFYIEPDAEPNKEAMKRGCLCKEMESFALFSNAKVLHKNAACLLTISDSLVAPEDTTPEERVSSFTNMMKIALDSILL